MNTSRTLLVFLGAVTLGACARDHATATDAPVTNADAPVTNAAETSTAMKPTDPFHALSYQSLEGKEVPLSSYDGKVLLVVNVASKCGFTPQYKGLETLSETYGPKGLVVIGFPSNEFKEQEPGDAAEIRAFCTEKYGVTFPLASKVEVKPGPNQSPVYQYLSNATGSVPGWNFCKYLVGKDGKVVGFYPSKVTPEDPKLRADIDKALGTN